ncbi:MAG: ATPase, T2SS/T4P/T4SS family [Kangiellaceae bacterium]|nr:ATPase, T2SS/T4P/T4SS family [Kangiellaceae bacterium]
MRDAETASIAFQAALTGHVVYSTLHTNSAIATVARLFDLGLRPYVIASALEAIIAQRLVRKLCQHCKTEASLDEKKLKLLGEAFSTDLKVVYSSKGCEHCQGSGLKGRVGLYEVLIFDEEIRQAITSQKSFIEIAGIAQTKGLKTLLQDAREKVDKGRISIDEVIRVLGAQS